MHEITERLSILRIIHAHSMCSRRSIVANDIVVNLKATTEQKQNKEKELVAMQMSNYFQLENEKQIKWIQMKKDIITVRIQIQNVPCYQCNFYKALSTCKSQPIVILLAGLSYIDCVGHSWLEALMKANLPQACYLPWQETKC